MLRTSSPVTWILIYGGEEYQVSRIRRDGGKLSVEMRSWTNPRRKPCRFSSPEHGSVGDLLKVVVETGQAQGRPVHLLKRVQGYRNSVTDTLVL
jgi:hypothetical protein